MRGLACWYLFWRWKRTLPRLERIRLEYWGATGNWDHHPFAWADWDHKILPAPGANSNRR